MKNKMVKLSPEAIIGIFVVLVLIGILLVMNLDILPQEPEFKITKEECWNETNLECGLGCIYYFDLIKDMNVSNLNKCNRKCDEFFELNKDCEQIEVGDCVETIDGECWEDLISIEWLNENCVCEIFSMKLPESFTDKEAMKYCEKYKCDSYFMEVVK